MPLRGQCGAKCFAALERLVLAGSIAALIGAGLQLVRPYASVRGGASAVGVFFRCSLVFGFVKQMLPIWLRIRVGNRCCELS